MSEKEKGPELSVVLALIAVLISVCTMVISLVETSIMQKQQQAMTESAKVSVWPYVTTLTTTGMDNGEIQFKMIVENKGVGPALINTMELLYDGNSVDKSLIEAVRDHCPDAIVTNYFSNSIQKMILSPGEKKSIVSFNLKDADFMNFAQFTEKVDTRYCYSNIYGDIWVSTDSTPVESKECE